MVISYESLIHNVSEVFWPIPRISGVFLTMPLMSSSFMPSRIRIAFILALAFIVSPFIKTDMSFLHFSAGHLIILLFEVLLGLMMGFVFQMVFQVFIIGGHIIAMQTGLGFATMVDPASKASVPIISQLFLMLVSLMFLSLNGHLAFFEALIGSFQTIPVGGNYFELSDLGRVIEFSGWMIKESVLVALPAILSLLIVSLSFGVMARVAPQLNIFSIGFPITLLMGILILYLSLPGVASQISDSLMQGMQVIKGLVQ